MKHRAWLDRYMPATAKCSREEGLGSWRGAQESPGVEGSAERNRAGRGVPSWLSSAASAHPSPVPAQKGK